jgi:hypothetical protein
MMMTPAGRRRPAPLCVCDLWSLGARIFEIPAQHPKTTNDYYYTTTTTLILGLLWVNGGHPLGG